MTCLISLLILLSSCLPDCGEVRSSLPSLPEVIPMRRLLAIASLLLALPAGRADDGEDAATKAFEKLGGRVVRNPKGKVIEVNIRDTAATDADLKKLAPLK